MTLGHEEHKHEAPKSVDCAIITISDSRTQENDTSGALIRDALEGAGHETISYVIIKDEQDIITRKVEEHLDESKVRVVLINGGTGIGSRDVTFESIRPILEKELPGFGELFRMLSYKEIGPSAIMSRAFAGVAKGKVVICLPGSTNAVKLAMNEIVLPELGHLVREVSK